MKNIDFLPDIYRQREALRRARVWWAGVVVVFGVVLGSVGGTQAWLRRRLEAELAQLAPQYAAAQADINELATLRSQIALASHEANLFTFLEHPWPRTQIVAHLVRPLPKSIALTQIHLTEEPIGHTHPAAGVRKSSQPGKEARPLPAEQDLSRLRGDVERRHTVVEISGTTVNVVELHQYVAALNDSPLVASAQIKLIDATVKDAGDLPTTFNLRVQIEVGHGLPRGSRLPSASKLHSLPTVASRLSVSGTLARAAGGSP